MKLQKLAGATSEIWQVFIADASSATGAGLTGLTNASAGLTAYYHRDTDTTATAITLVTMTVGTFTSSGFKEIDATNMPGWYQFCPPNAALASGAKSCAFLLKGATNMAPLPIEVQLTAVNPDSATGFVSSVPAVVGAVGSVTAGVTVTTNNDKTGYALTQTFPANFSSLGISAGGAISTVTLVTTTTTLTNAPSDSSGVTTLLTRVTATRAGNLDNLDAAVSTRMATYTQPTGFLAATFPATVGSATLAGDLSATMKTSVEAAVWDAARASHTTAGSFGQGVASVQGAVTGSVASVTGNVGGSVASVTAAVTVGTMNAGVIDSASIATAAKQSLADTMLDRDMSVGTDSGGRTVRNAFRVLRNKVDTVAGIVYKEDDTTTAFTFAVTTAAGSPIVAVDPA